MVIMVLFSNGLVRLCIKTVTDKSDKNRVYVQNSKMWSKLSQFYTHQNGKNLTFIN